jgi:cytochrome c553
MRVALFTAGALLVLALAAGLGALAVSASGVIPVKASSGHFAITEWFLVFSKERSIATHTLGEELTGLDDPALVALGAGHYESGCRPCHGSPGQPTPVVPAAMLPPPPDLTVRALDYAPEELFYIVKHGIKLTGMPMWPAQSRDDEVRAVTAFLVRMPELDATGYRKLVHGATGASESESGLAPATDDQPAQLARELCARCHGPNGEGGGHGAFPRLAGQRAEYVQRALTAYKHGERHSGVMKPLAAPLDEGAIRMLADHYASLSADSRFESKLEPAAIERGRKIARDGVLARKVPACMECHGPQPLRRNEAYPRLAGQSAWYLQRQLELLAAERRGGSSYVHLMHEIAPRLTADQIRDVAAFYASLAPSETTLPAQSGTGP